MSQNMKERSNYFPLKLKYMEITCSDELNNTKSTALNSMGLVKQNHSMPRSF